jgi:hypothetical protein
MNTEEKKTFKPSAKLILTAVIILIIAITSIAASVKVDITQDSITAGATFSGKTTVNINDIEDIRLTDSLNPGSRVMGLGLPWLLGGKFNNSEYGDYKLYSYTGCKVNIVIVHNGEILVFNQKTEEKTNELYNRIREIMGG